MGSAASFGCLAPDHHGVARKRNVHCGRERSKTILWKAIHSLVHRVDKGGELAITHYRVLRRHRDKSLLELTLETGRKNQVRVQLAALGHPIIGDRKYGARTEPARRLALHSCDLKFRHPVSGAPMEFHSGLPGQLKQLMELRVARAK